jgi:glycosyltransferase involved in cell wall biosynthesis
VTADRRLIGLNALLLSDPGTYRGAGISGYIAGLLGALPGAAPELDYLAWVSHRWDALPFMPQRVAPVTGDRIVKRVAWEQTGLPLQARRAGVALLHGMAFSVPLLSPCPSVVTLFDMSFALFPAYHPRGRRTYLSLMTRLSTRQAEKVIAISESTRHDICRVLRVPEEKVVVIPLGVGDRYRPLSEAEREAFRARKGIGPYIFFQGTIEPRKNLLRLVRAYARLRQDGKLPHRLVLGGPPGWGSQALGAEIERLGLADDVTLLGYVPQEEAPQWYAAAELFVYPSLYEGFGLPPLEAMACGTPVIVAASSSLPEVVGDAGLLVSPLNVDAMANAMGEVLGDAERRRSMSERGLERARSYTWTEAARATAALYNSCLA